MNEANKFGCLFLVCITLDLDSGSNMHAHVSGKESESMYYSIYQGMNKCVGTDAKINVQTNFTFHISHFCQLETAGSFNYAYDLYAWARPMMPRCKMA